MKARTRSWVLPPGSNRRWRTLAVIGGLLLAIALDHLSAAEPVPLPAATRAEIRALQLEKASRTPAQRKLDSQLVYATRLRRGERIAPGVDRLTPALRLPADGRLLLDLDATVTPDLLGFIEQRGGTIINSFAQHRAIRALLPLDVVEDLAARADVHRVRPADEATTQVVSEGDVTHRAGEARATYKIGGEGVKVGVLSDSVDYLVQSQATGELPPVTILPGQAGIGVGEGTAMLEIIHDLAPQAELYFATAFLGQASFAENIRALYAAGCRIIIDDVTYFAESPFQDGTIARAVNDVSAGGALFFSSAGNSGNQNDGTSGTWEGDFVDGGPATSGRGGRLHDFGGTPFNTLLPGGGFIRVDLFWSDPLGRSTNDYDVYVVDGNGSVIRSSTNLQDGDDDPYENIGVAAIGERIVIVKHAGEDRHLHLDTGRAILSVSTSGYVRGHNASGASNAFCVGATWVKSPALPFVGGAEHPVELFSSDGPRRMFFNADGTPITPGDYSSTGGVALRKPDIVAADGGATSVLFFNPFFGTSAAAPHAGAIAALLLSYNPDLSPAEVREALESTALDIEAPGVDRDSGVGIVMAPASVLAVPPPAPRLFFSSAAVGGGNGNASLDSNERAEMFVTLENIITAQGEAATGVVATLTTTTPEVTTDPTPRSFIDIPPFGTGTNVAPFLISTTPSFLCGTRVDLQLSVTTANAGSFSLPFHIISTAPGVGIGVTFDSPDPQIPIPDLSTIESTATVSGISLQLGKVTVAVHARHPYASDLAMTLIGPDGTAVDLSSANGASAANYGDDCSARTVFDDDALTSIVVASAPFVGAFRPEQSLSAYFLKTGASVNGVWRLRVSDLAAADTGSLECWSLTVAPIACLDGGGGGFTAPAITSHPEPVTAVSGGTAEFAVQATGTPPLQYQWYFNTTNELPGATNSILLLPNVAPAMAGEYRARVVNLYGEALSEPAGLTVVEIPTIVQQPSSLTATNGGIASLAVLAQGTEPLSYQWYRNGSTPVPGATHPSLVFDPVTTNSAGEYFAVASNPYGQATSVVATLSVVVPPFIFGQPSDLTVFAGQTASFTVAAGGTAPLTYQWYYNETNALAAGAEATLELPSVTHGQAGGYSVVVSNLYGRATSREAVLTVETPTTNELPIVILTSPADGSTFTVDTTPIALEAVATDADGVVTNVDFYAGGGRLAAVPASPYEFAWLDPEPGDHELWAVAMDDSGGSATSMVARVSVGIGTSPLASLISTGALWKYNDSGTDLGAAWREPNYDDGAWTQGPAELGYGDAPEGRPEATVISFGPNPENKFRTAYFRRSFVLTDAASFTSLRIRLLRDDGAVVYLNGVEVWRDNLGNGAIAFTNFASQAIGGTAEATFLETNVSANLLANGPNVVAVEIHQASVNSSDLSFDLQLQGERSFAPRIVSQPQDQNTITGGDVEFAVTAEGPGVLRYQWYFSDSALDDETNRVLQLPGVTTNNAGPYQVTVINDFGSVTSRVAVLTVEPPPNQPPTVALTSPADGAIFEFGQAIALAATANDPDGQIGSVQFFGNEGLVATVGLPPFQFDWLTAPPGSNSVFAVAIDDGGLAVTSSVVHVHVLSPAQPLQLVSTGAVWKYLDDGSDQGTLWRTPVFDDSTWASGPAQLGFGDGDEQTVIRRPPPPSRSHITFYFRHTFSLGDPSLLSSLFAFYRRDDGIIVYLNGVELFRNNMPTGTVSAITLASGMAADDGNVWFTNSVPPSLLVSGDNVLAAEVHQNVTGSPDLSFDLGLAGMAGMMPPLVVITSPTNHQSFAGPVDVPVSVSAIAMGGSDVSRVSLLVNGVEIAAALGEPYQFTITNAGFGHHVVTAVAIDTTGLAATSAPIALTVFAPVAFQTLVATGSVWNYLDTGVDQGTAWREPAFDDSNWPEGPAELGYGDEADGRPEATVISFGSDPEDKHPTYYFRHAFRVEDAALFTATSFRLLRDDGAVVYLNGSELFRSNMPEGEIQFDTFAVTAVSREEEAEYLASSIASNVLATGTNLLAVEVHQINSVSSDLSFDLELVGAKASPPFVETQPVSLTIAEGGSAQFKVSATGTPPLSYQWFFNSEPLGGPGSDTLELNAVQPGQAGAYFAEISNVAGTTRSDQAVLTVVPDSNAPPVVVIVTPTNGAQFAESAIIGIRAQAGDPDGTIAGVTFLDGSTQLAVVTNEPYVFDWAGAGIGTHTLTALAVDNRGGATLSDPVNITVLKASPTQGQTVTLISTGAVWKYLDDGSNQGTAWRDSLFDDSAWAEGAAELGYGDDVDGRPETTVLGFGPDPANKFPTYYFRHSFVLDNLTRLSELRLRLLCDDGAVVYLNGVEVFRSNLPKDEVLFDTFAVNAVVNGAETVLLETNAPRSLLQFGTNLVAVEVHQADPASSDVSFDLELIGIERNAPTIVTQPQDQNVAVGDTAQFTVVAIGAPQLRYQWFLNALTPIPDATNATLIISNVQPFHAGSYSVTVTNRFGTAQSSPAVLRVLTRPIILSEPESQIVGVGDSAQFGVTAGGTVPLHYQWYFEMTNALPDRTNATLVLMEVQPSDAGSYSVVVTNLAGSVTSIVAMLTVTNVLPVILSQPQTVTVQVGQPASLTVVAESPLPLRYQWYFEATTALDGKTNATLAFAAVQPTDFGDYRVVVSSDAGSVESATATLRVLVPNLITEIQLLPGVATNVIFPTFPGLRYTLEFSTNLGDIAVWPPVDGASKLLATNSFMIITDPTASPLYRFYRVKIE